MGTKAKVRRIRLRWQLKGNRFQRIFCLQYTSVNLTHKDIFLTFESSPSKPTIHSQKPQNACCFAAAHFILCSIRNYGLRKNNPQCDYKCRLQHVSITDLKLKSHYVCTVSFIHSASQQATVVNNFTPGQLSITGEPGNTKVSVSALTTLQTGPRWPTAGQKDSERLIGRQSVQRTVKWQHGVWQYVWLNRSAWRHLAELLATRTKRT